MKAIISKVCEICEITIDDFYSKSRYKELVFARQMVAWMLRDRFTLDCIGRKLNQNHSTVYYSIQKVKSQIEIQDKQTLNFIDKFNEL